MYKFAMIFGLALIMAALAILGHDCQLWFERGAWASTTIDGTLELVRLNDDLMDRLRHVNSLGAGIAVLLGVDQHRIRRLRARVNS